MAELKLSTVWKVEGVAAKNHRLRNANEKCIFQSDKLVELQHKSLPGLQWKAQLYSPAAKSKDKAGFYMVARFGFSHEDAKYVLASYTATVLDVDLSALATGESTAHEYVFRVGGTFFGWGMSDFFELESLTKAVQNDGRLRIRVDLTIMKIHELLNCRELLRGLLNTETLTDFEVKVEGETFKLHKCVLSVSGMEVAAADSVLDLSDITNPAAFKAFAQAIYFDNWNFLSNVDLTQDVLHLAEKFKVLNVKTYCDDSLAEKVNEANALDILTKSAALCNAEKTQAACVEILAKHAQFKKCQAWLDFKQRNRGVAMEILEVINEKVMSILERENAELKRE